MTELSWPIEKIEPYRGAYYEGWLVLFSGGMLRSFTTDQLVAAGIPAQPYPTPPVTITVTVGHRSEDVEMDDENVAYLDSFAEFPTTTMGKIGAALRRLGVQP